MWRKVIYGIACLLLAVMVLPNRASGYNGPGDTATVADEMPGGGDFDYILPAEALSGTLPFSIAGNLIIIQANADAEKGNFILDTGAPGLVLNLTYFRDYPASARSEEEAGGISGTVTGGAPTIIKKLGIGPFHYSTVNAHRVNLGHIENLRGIKILGLLGSGLFSRFEMVIDYENQVIHLHRLAKAGKGANKGLSKPTDGLFETIPMRMVDGKILLKATIGAQKLNFVLDTGAENNILDSRLGDEVFSGVVMENKITLTGAGATKVNAWYGRAQQVMVGAVKLENELFLVTSLKKMSEAFGTNIDGMLGHSFLVKQKIGINFLNNELYIWK